MLLRVVVGVFFLLHGIQKFTGLGGVQGFFDSIGIFSWLAVVIALAETLGGLALIVGIWTRWASYMLAVIMVGAFVFAAFSWGALGWIFVIAAAVGMAATDCNWRSWGCWLLAVVLAVIVIKSIVMQISPIAPKANLERDLTFLAALLTIAWSGAGRMSLHGNCNCCKA